MTAVDPEDVVLYDIDLEASTEELYADPETQWFAVKRMAGNAVRAAGDFNPLLHPRGRDGRFINKFGWIRWLDMGSGKWIRGQVTEIDNDGTAHVKVGYAHVADFGSDATSFSHSDLSERVYTIATPKGALSLPDPSMPPEGADPSWKKTGGQGGSNPGGMYQREKDSYFSYAQVQAIVKSSGLYTTTSKGGDATWLDTGNGIYWDDATGEMYRFKDGQVTALHGGEALENPPAGSFFWGNDENVDEAWFLMEQQRDAFAAGHKFYVKKTKSLSHAANEVLANRFYELAGVPVAETSRGANPQIVASKLVPSTDEKVNIGDKLSDPAVMKRMREDMVVDAWLANWDVVGMGLENTQVVDGVPYRIDAGGALYYRAQGAPKGNKFGPGVVELVTLKNSSLNPQAAKVFGTITEEEEFVGARKVAAVNPADIVALVDATDDAPPDLADTLIARRQFILDTYELDDPWLLPPEMVPMDAAGGEDTDETVDVSPEDATPPIESIKPDPIADIGPMNLEGVTGFVGDVYIANGSGQVYPISDAVLDDTSGVDLVHFTGANQGMWAHVDNVFDSEEKAQKAAAALLAKQEAMPTGEPAPIPEAVSEVENGAIEPGVALGGSKQWNAELGQWIDGKPTMKAGAAFEKITTAMANDESGQWKVPAALKPSEDVIVYDGFFYTPVYIDKSMNDGKGAIGVEGIGPLATLTTLPYTEHWTTSASNLDTLGTLHVDMVNASLTEDAITLSTNPTQYGHMVMNPMDPAEAMPGEITWPGIKTEELVAGTFQYSNDYSNNMKWVMHELGSLEVGEFVWWDNEVFMVHEPFVTPSGMKLLRLEDVHGNKPNIPAPTSDYDDEKSVYVARNAYTRSLFAAVWAAQEANLEEDDLTPTPVDEALIKHLDNEAKTSKLADEMAPDEPAVASLEGKTIPFNIAYDSLFAKSEYDLEIDNNFIIAFQDKYGYNIGPIPADEFGDWMDENGVDKARIGMYLAENGSTDFFGPQSPHPAQPTKPQVVPGVNDQLSVTSKINFGTYGTEGNDLVAESLVGKMIFIQYADPEKQNVQVGESLWYYGSSKTAGTYGIFYVEKFDADTGRLVGRTPKGAQFALNTHGWNNETYDIYDVSASIEVDDIKGMTGPTKKANGDITVNGVVVGSWKKADTEYSWYTAYEYTIFAPFSSTGSDVKGITKTQTGISKFSSLNIIPPKKAVTKKKTASKEYAAVKEMVNTDIPGDPLLSNGEPAKLGDWVQATKGGGGFVGKIVGWPNQETHPGLAFAVGIEGVQKLVKLKTQKKVPAPDNVEYIDPDVDFAGQPIPSAYTGIKLADDKIPLVGQKVKAGAPGSEIEGIITNINLEQGWVYILQADGKKKSKTFSVTTVLEEPDLIWDADVHPVAVAKAKKASAPAGKKKGKGPTWPAPDGSVIEQTQETKDAWLAGHPKRKLTKDGYAPYIGMRIRMKDGSEGTIVKINDAWASNPNGIKVHTFDGIYTSSAGDVPNGVIKGTSVSTIEVDHANELLGFESKPPAKIHSLKLAGQDNFAELPNGTQIFAVPWTAEWYSYEKSKYRSVQTTRFIILTPDGTAQVAITNNYGNKITKLHGWSQFEALLKGSYGTPSPHAPLEHVGTIDSSADPSAIFSIKAHDIINKPGTGNNYNSEKTIEPAQWGWYDPVTGLTLTEKLPDGTVEATLTYKTAWEMVDAAAKAKGLDTDALGDEFAEKWNSIAAKPIPQSDLDAWATQHGLDLGFKKPTPPAQNFINGDPVSDEEMADAIADVEQAGYSLVPDDTIKEAQEKLAELEAEAAAEDDLENFTIDPAEQGTTPLPPEVEQAISDEEAIETAGYDTEPEDANTPTVKVDENGNPIGEGIGFTPPDLIPGNSLGALVPPPAPPELEDDAPTYPTVPKPTQTKETAYKLDGKPSVLAGTSVKSIREAGIQQIAQKDSKAVATGHTYALGDSDLVEDMAFRFNVEDVDGNERLVLRFRLREDMTEEQIGKLMVTSGGGKGAWKRKGEKYPIDLEPGDAINIRVGTNQAGTYGDTSLQMLKPPKVHLTGKTVYVGGEQSPNVRVVAKPVYLGVTGGEAGELDTYRVRVRNEQGVEGDLDIQMRPIDPNASEDKAPTVTTFEWDHTAPAINTGASLTLSPKASEVGWMKTGGMTMWKKTGTTPEHHSGGEDLTNAQGKFVRKSSWATFINTMATGTGGQRMVRTEDDGTEIVWNSAHSVEGGTGNETTRRANLSGTVEIAVPLDGRGEEDILASMSRSMEWVGLGPEAQTAPDNAQLVKWAMSKLVANYHPKFDYRGPQVTGPEDKRVAETLAHMTKELKPHIGRDVTLEDVRLHTHENGRLQVMLSPEVGKAIAKRQGIKVHRHSGAGTGVAFNLFGGPNPGLLSSDERFSLGVVKSGLSSYADMRIGSGDRVYTLSTTSVHAGHVNINPAVHAMGLEQYNNQHNSSDNFGRRGTTNLYMTTGPGVETMYKRAIDRTMLTMYVTSSDAEAEALIEKLKKAGVTHIGGRPIELIIVSQTKAKYMIAEPNWLDTGMEVFAEDIPITKLLGLTAGGALVVNGVVYTDKGAEFALTNGATR